MLMEQREHFSTIKIIDLHGHRLTSRDVDVITSSLLRTSAGSDPSRQSIALTNGTELPLSEFVSLKIVDLSSNWIDKTVASSLSHWVDLPSCPFINISSTPICVKSVRHLADSLMDIYQDVNRVNKYISQCIIMSKDYINSAVKKPLYKQLIDDQILLSNWADRHYQFYDSNLWKRYQWFRENERHRQCFSAMRLLSLTSNNDRPNYPVEDNEEKLSFMDCLRLIGPPPMPPLNDNSLLN